MIKLSPIPKHRLVTAQLLGEEITEKSAWREWRRNGQLHREDGPAIEWPDGYKAWWRNGMRQRNE